MMGTVILAPPVGFDRAFLGKEYQTQSELGFC